MLAMGRLKHLNLQRTRWLSNAAYGSSQSVRNGAYIIPSPRKIGSLHERLWCRTALQVTGEPRIAREAPTVVTTI